MKKVYSLNLQDVYADDVLSGHKPFDIRSASVGFQAGDYIEYRTVDKSLGFHVPHDVEGKRFKITYVMSGDGIREGYVVLGLKHSGSTERKKAKKINLCV